MQRQLGPGDATHGTGARPAAPRRRADTAGGHRAASRRAGDCRIAEDRLAAGLAEIDDWARELREAPDEYEQLRLLHDAMPKVGLRIGKKDNWKCDIDEVRAQLAALRTLVHETDTAVAVAAARRLTWAIAQFTLAEAQLRRRGGRLEFHDLLVLSRAVLRDPERGPDVRQRLRERYTRLLLDEFQDTDPIQGDLAMLLASADPDAAERPWNEITTDPGRLFVVGDPKQSIYRFRRADIAAFLRMRDTFANPPFRHGAARRPGTEPLAVRARSRCAVHRLTRNFRSAPAVIEFVNHVFVDLIVAEPDSQPEYVALDPARDDAPPGGSGPELPAVVLLGAEPHPDVADPDDLTAKARKPSAGELRDAEAADVAAVVRAALADGWQVTRRRAEGDTVWEPCRPGDIAILLPARTSLGQLEDALDAAGIPYRAETSSLVYGTPEIRNLLLTLRAIDDPTDELTLVSALRSPLFGCGDDDLYTFKVEHGGSWNHQAPLPESLPLDHPVGDALRALAEWYDARLWLDASELLDRIVRDRRVLEAAFVHGRPRDLWRRVRFVIDQARAFAEASTVGGTHGSGLRDFLAWADLQSAEGARVVETVLPETDDDAVRILTIHGAKGLEFPIAIVSGTTTAARTRRGGVQLLFPHDSDTYALRVSARVTTEEFERYEPIDEQMDFHEKLRLLYVGLTRARDHLVVSVHRAARPPAADDRTKWTHAELLWSAAESAPNWRPLDDVAAAPAAPPSPAAVTPEPAPPVPPWAEWHAERDAVLARRVHSTRPLGHRDRARGRADRGIARRSRPAQGRARPGAAAVEQGPVRHRGGTRRARGAPDRRPRHRRGRRSGRPPRRQRRKVSSARRPRSRRWHVPRSAPTWCAPRSPAGTGARCTSPRRSAAASSRATSTSSTGPLRRSGTEPLRRSGTEPLRRPGTEPAAGSWSSTTRPMPGTTTPTSTPSSSSTGSRARPTRWRWRRPPARRWRSACSCSSGRIGR